MPRYSVYERYQDGFWKKLFEAQDVSAAYRGIDVERRLREKAGFGMAETRVVQKRSECGVTGQDLRFYGDELLGPAIPKPDGPEPVESESLRRCAELKQVLEMVNRELVVPEWERHDIPCGYRRRVDCRRCDSRMGCDEWMALCVLMNALD